MCNFREQLLHHQARRNIEARTSSARKFRVQVCIEKKLERISRRSHELFLTPGTKIHTLKMPGIKRKSLEEDGVKIKESKKVKAEKDVVSKADKKFANKLAKKDKKSDMSVKEERKEKSNGFKKSKKEPTPEESSIEEEDFGNEDQMVVDQEDDEMDNTENVKPVKQAKGDAGKISEAPAVLKGSTDGANGM